MNAMRLLMLSLGLASTALFPASGRAEREYDPSTPAEEGFGIGQPAPMQDVRMKGVSGTEISIAEVAGTKGTLVIFTCNHCP